jgi:hypothetical protein
MSVVSSCTELSSHYECIYNGKKFNTTKIYRPYIGICTYRNGYWDDWSRESSLRTKVSYSGATTIIVYYSKYNHPGDFDYKIELNEYIGSSGEWGKWDEYKGEITIKKSCESVMKNYYSNPMAGVQALKDYWTFPCKIKRTYHEHLPLEKYIYPQLESPLEYVYNVWYNGVGRGFEINGKWVGADEYDSW